MKVLVLSAMSRPQTATHRLAQLAADACAAHGADVELVTPAELAFPVNDGTMPWDLPELVRWRERVAASDASIWVSPEYHGAVAASLKNMFDFLERGPLEGSVVGLCALAAGTVAALNTLNGMSIIARSLGAWVVPNMCAFGSREISDGLSEGGLRRLDSMCATVIDTARKLGGPVPVAGDVTGPVKIAMTVEESDPDVPVSVPLVPRASDAREQGRGISGIRYVAQRDGRSVYLRVLGAELVDRDLLEREQASLRTLPPHPNLVPVLDVGMTTGGDAYVASPANLSLVDRLRESGPIPWKDAMDTGVRLAGALETVHAEGLLHRDLGPFNVVYADGRPALADVAVAPVGVRALENQRQIALAHLAPELFLGEPPAVTSDIYSLGATLFAMVVGRPAFTDDAERKVIALIRRIAGEPVPDLRGYIPEAFCIVIERAMAKSPADRFSSAEELGRALQQAQMLTELPTATMTFFRSTAGQDVAPAGVISVLGAGDVTDSANAWKPDTESGGSEIM